MYLLRRRSKCLAGPLRSHVGAGIHHKGTIFRSSQVDCFQRKTNLSRHNVQSPRSDVLVVRLPEETGHELAKSCKSPGSSLLRLLLGAAGADFLVATVLVVTKEKVLCALRGLFEARAIALGEIFVDLLNHVLRGVRIVSDDVLMLTLGADAAVKCSRVEAPLRVIFICILILCKLALNREKLFNVAIGLASELERRKCDKHRFITTRNRSRR